MAFEVPAQGLFLEGLVPPQLESVGVAERPS